MERELLFKFLRCETTPHEENLIADWLEADAGHRRELNAMRLTMEGMALCAPALDRLVARKRPRTISLGRIALRGAAAAAVVAIAVLIGYKTASHKLTRLMARQTTVEVSDGNRLSITLGDGTKAWLNSGTRLEYPSSFSGDRRVVRLDGEALFDVSPDDKWPFIVKTFAYDVKVLGTKFNVRASEHDRVFSTALLSGSVQLVNEKTRERFTMSPGEMVKLKSGRLCVYRNMERIEDEILWVDGILNLKGYDFAELMKRIETSYNVRIVNNCLKVDSTVRYERGKIWMSEGVEHSLELLQKVYSFDYVWDRERNVITVTDR